MIDGQLSTLNEGPMEGPMPGLDWAEGPGLWGPISPLVAPPTPSWSSGVLAVHEETLSLILFNSSESTPEANWNKM